MITTIESRPLDIDPKRAGVQLCGVCVRARDPKTGRFKAYDIAMLERRSLIRWLAEDAQRCRNTVLAMLRHDPV